MKLILIRHGESEANIAGLLSSGLSDKYGLTDKGREQVKSAAKKFRGKIDTLYISPLLRTEQTAKIFIKETGLSPLEIIEDRVKEIDYGIFSGHKNNSELDNARKEQIADNYKIRFGKTGENKYEILSRLYNFLIDIIENSSSGTVVAVISHGSITGWLERIVLSTLKTDMKHTHIKNGDIRKYELLKRDLVNLINLRSELDGYI